ncbi:hypothetical protein WR25_11582 [Diploscapter pachys]|uniref:CUB domain-containing protein n=1 Tax=Diploscapter pachys TaxID=2018661 RepID=A0A2A2L0C1_9BILA|nr:hypothetical protein WR25_11582 [Diploscapter pachys]
MRLENSLPAFYRLISILSVVQSVISTQLCAVCRDEDFFRSADLNSEPTLVMRKKSHNIVRGIRSCAYHENVVLVQCDYACLEVRVHRLSKDSIYRDCSEHLVARLHGQNYTQFNESAVFNATDKFNQKVTIKFCHDKGEQCFEGVSFYAKIRWDFASIGIFFLLLLIFSCCIICISYKNTENFKSIISDINCLTHVEDQKAPPEEHEMASTTTSLSRKETMTASCVTDSHSTAKDGERTNGFSRALSVEVHQL